jgi:hypothetical protein
MADTPHESKSVKKFWEEDSGFYVTDSHAVVIAVKRPKGFKKCSITFLSTTMILQTCETLTLFQNSSVQPLTHQIM